MNTELSAIIESLVFTADSALSTDRICELLSEYQRDEIKTALAEMVCFSSGAGRGL